MRPADLIMRVRRRSEWEAIDLGFILIRAVWRSLFPAWLILMASAVALCMLLIPQDYFWIAGLLLWWIKPLFDRVLLYTLSRQLFGQQPGIAEVFSAIPGLMRNTGLVGALSWRRFSLSRSYNLPIWQLEQLRGEPRKQRHDLLYLQGHSTAIGLTVVCVLLELIIVASIYTLIVLLDPSGQAWEHLQSSFNNTSDVEMKHLLELAGLSIQSIAVLLIEPFFVAAGFALYLNRRTQLEAWDIEITFRSLGERLQQLAEKSGRIELNNTQSASTQSPHAQAIHTAEESSAPGTRAVDLRNDNKTRGTMLTLLGTTLLIGILTSTPGGVQAAESEFLNAERLPVTESSSQLEQVMQVEELNELRQTSTWVPRDKSKPEKQTALGTELVQLIAAIFKYLIWALVLIALLLGLIYHKKILALLKPSTKTDAQTTPPSVLFGLDIRPESLPDDIAGAAKQLWQQGATRAALSLLYRGTLMQLTQRYATNISDSHTEGDILRITRPQLDEQRFDYLSRITRCWQTIAYAHRTPPDAEIEPLFDDWQQWAAVPIPAPQAVTQTAHPAQAANTQEQAG